MVEIICWELMGLKQQQIEEYEANSCTAFVRPIEYGSKIFSQIFELEDQYLSPFKPLDIMKKSCNYFGVDYESRRRGTSQLIGYTRKLPIAVEPNNHIFFFPTASPNHPECIWISYEHVENFRRIGSKQTQITFRNNQSYIFPVSYGTIEGQILRTALLKNKLLQRIEGENRRLYFWTNGKNALKASEKPIDYESGNFIKGKE